MLAQPAPNAMNAIETFLGDAPLWLAFNLGNALAILTASTAIIAPSLAIVLFMAHRAKRQKAMELARYGACRRPLTSFVCKTCLHRSYAATHVRLRYCVQCDKYYPDKPKVWRCDDVVKVRISPEEPPAPLAGELATHGPQVRTTAESPHFRSNERSLRGKVRDRRRSTRQRA